MRKFRGYASLAGSDHVEIEFEVPDDATDDVIEDTAIHEAIDVLHVSYSEVGKPDPDKRGSGILGEIMSKQVMARYIRGAT
ncbi:MAG: hypothetical protein EBW87_00655 [Burkholderiaceae bacterium]|nr:hypothetical protein [Burkholderiaceae bacterium]